MQTEELFSKYEDKNDALPAPEGPAFPPQQYGDLEIKYYQQSRNFNILADKTFSFNVFQSQHDVILFPTNNE